MAHGDLYLSPESRLLADSAHCEGPAPAVFTFDGHGHRLVLPPPSAVEQQAVPLILVGPGRTLRLRNVRVVHAASLPRCVQLAAGAALDVRPENHCVLLDGADPTLAAAWDDETRSAWRSVSLTGTSGAPRCVLTVDHGCR